VEPEFQVHFPICVVVKFIKQGTPELLEISPAEIGTPASTCCGHYCQELTLKEGFLRASCCSDCFVSGLLILLTFWAGYFVVAVGAVLQYSWTLLTRCQGYLPEL